MSSNFWASSHCKYWQVSRTHLENSKQTDLKYATRRQLSCLSIWFANLIQKLGKRLLLRQIPIATATVFFRRFYLKNSYCETNPYLVLAACCFVAAKVEETPVHIKSVVAEAKIVFTEHNIKMFPPEPNKLGEMEFYLMEDLDFHLTVFHPYRALVSICGREPADSGRYPKSRVEEDAEIRKKETDIRKKRDDDIRKSGGVGAVGGKEKDEMNAGEDEREKEVLRVRRLMGRGSGEGLMEIEEGVLQIAWFTINDTYRTDVTLLYPPYVIALAALYIAFTLTTMTTSTNSNSANNNTTATATSTTSTRTRSSSSQVTSLSTSIESNTSLNLQPPPTTPADFLASFEVSLPVLMACVQDIIVLYPIWERFEPSPTRSGGGASNSMAANAAAARNGVDKEKDKEREEKKFGPDEAEALVRRMIEERIVDIGHPENAGKTIESNGRNGNGIGSGSKKRSRQ